jgi:23S rRNA (uracil1939-C5)-methyltransferase
LNKNSVRAGDLKSVILRATQQGEVVAALFVKTDAFIDIALPASLRGIKVYHSNPKSPASVATKLLYSLGDISLQDALMNTVMTYDVIGFFQVNLPVFQKALSRIDECTAGARNKVDMYAGVGSIGIPIGDTSTLVELDSANVAMARQNAKDTNIEVVEASTEQALGYIQQDMALIVDPPRSGLHKDVVARILEVRPRQICYLSCNPATQARDIALLQEAYTIKGFDCYNFFPLTPHIETLCILEAK